MVVKLKSKSILWKCACAFVCVVIFIFLVNRVVQKAHPWEKILHIENGLDGDDYSSFTMVNRKVVCFSPDEETLFVATASGLVEAWDVTSMVRKNVFGKKLIPDPDEENPHLKGAWNIEVNELGQLVESRWDGLLIHSMEGDLIAEHELDIYRSYAVSENGKWLAGGHLDPEIMDLETGDAKPLLPDVGLNGGNARYQWSADGRKLLFNDAVLFAIFDGGDLDAWKLRFKVRTEHIDLVNASKRELAEPLDKDRKWVAMLMDSQFVDGDSKVASIYNAVGWRMSAVYPLENVLRFTGVESGELLKSVQLPHPPRSMWVSDGGERIYVTMCPDASTVVNIYDAETMEELDSVASKTTNRFPIRVMGMSGEGNHILQYSGGAVVQDWAESYTPVRFEPLGNSVIQALVNKNANLIVTVMNSREINVWKKRREFSEWGAFSLWEYGASYLCMIALCLCLLPIYWLATGTLTERKRSFRKIEWLILVISGMTIALAIVRTVYQPLFGDIWLYYYEGFEYMKAFGLVVSLGCFIGLLYQNDGWRKANRFLSALGGLVTLGFLIYFVVQLSSVSPNTDVKVYSTLVPIGGFDGFKWSLTMLSVLVWMFLLVFYLFFKCWVLRVPFEPIESE